MLSQITSTINSKAPISQNFGGGGGFGGRGGGKQPPKKGIPSHLKLKGSPNPRVALLSNRLADQTTEIFVGYVPGSPVSCGNYMFFHILESIQSPWVDKLFNDWLKKAGEWAAKLGYSTTPLQLHENGIVLKNDKSFPFRVYIWFTDDDCASDEGHLRQECNFIAENLNSLPEVRGHQRVIVNNNFFLGADSVWSDVLGDGPQIMKLIRDVHGVIDKSSIVSDDEEFVGYSYWRRGNFPLEAARTLGMSNDDVRGGIFWNQAMI